MVVPSRLNFPVGIPHLPQYGSSWPVFQYGGTIPSTSIHWYLSYKLSTRDLEEMMAERGVHVDHSTIHRWVLRYTPELEAELRKRKKPVSGRWFWDETAIKVKGKLKWLYRAVDEDGETIDFLLTAKRDQKAALRFLKKVVRQHGIPEKINTDKSRANAAGLRAFNAEHSTDIELRQVKYLNNLIEQDHRWVRQRTRPMLGFKTFMSATKTIAGIEMMAMIKEGQIDNQGLAPFERFYALIYGFTCCIPSGVTQASTPSIVKSILPMRSSLMRAGSCDWRWPDLRCPSQTQHQPAKIILIDRIFHLRCLVLPRRRQKFARICYIKADIKPRSFQAVIFIDS